MTKTFTVYRPIGDDEFRDHVERLARLHPVRVQVDFMGKASFLFGILRYWRYTVTVSSLNDWEADIDRFHSAMGEI